MNCNYKDIIDRIAETPTWWDENSVPRYCEFSPKRVSNIYATEVALVLIHCQGCGQPFKVAVSSGLLDDKMSVQEWVRDGYWQIGSDPPNIGCCEGGQAMCSSTKGVIEFWIFDREWARDTSLEITFDESTTTSK
jgi:hypothetical protein